MNDVMQAVGVFFSYAVLAVFAQNAVFTRGLGVSRLVQLVGDERTSSGWFALLLCVTQVLVAPLAFYAGGFIAAQSNPAQLRPLVYLACVAVVSLFEFIVLWAARGKRHGGRWRRSTAACWVRCWWSAPRALRWSRAWASASAAAWAICWPSCW